MKRKSPSITSKLWSVSAILSILILWQLAVSLGLVEGFMLPSPVQVAGAFIKEFPALMENAGITLAEAGLGLVLGIATGFGAAVLMDRFDKAYKAFYPIIVLTQTVPAVAIAPLLVLWFGYEMAPKVILIVITTFFPIWARDDAMANVMSLFPSSGRELVSMMVRMPLPQNCMLVLRVLMASL